MFFYLVLTIPVRPDYLKIYRTDLRQIFRVGKTTAVDDQSEISFSIPLGTLQNKSMFGATTRAAARLLLTAGSLAVQQIDRYLLIAGPAKQTRSSGVRRLDGTDGQTDGSTDGA